MSMFREAAKDGVNTIFTFAYDKATDDPFVRKTIKTISKQGGTVCFVRLFCDEGELARRVNSKGRRDMGKISTTKLLATVLKKHGLAGEVPFQTSLSLDTTHLSAKRSARMIARALQAPEPHTSNSCGDNSLDLSVEMFPQDFGKTWALTRWWISEPLDGRVGFRALRNSLGILA